MVPLVYQIVIGELPTVLHKCVSSVKDYAKRHGYEYLCDTRLPEWAINLGMRPREASEWMRAEMLSSRPYVLWVDWDIEILGDFELLEEIITVVSTDSLIYYGNNTEKATEVLKDMGDRKDRVNDWGMGHFSFVKVFKNSYKKFILKNNMYIHHLYTWKKDKNIKTLT